MAIFIYSLVALFCAVISWAMYGLEMKYPKHPDAPKPNKVIHAVVPFIPVVNIIWVMYKLLQS